MCLDSILLGHRRIGGVELRADTEFAAQIQADAKLDCIIVNKVRKIALALEGMQ